MMIQERDMILRSTFFPRVSTFFINFERDYSTVLLLRIFRFQDFSFSIWKNEKTTIRTIAISAYSPDCICWSKIIIIFNSIQWDYTEWPQDCFDLPTTQIPFVLYRKNNWFSSRINLYHENPEYLVHTYIHTYAYHKKCATIPLMATQLPRVRNEGKKLILASIISKKNRQNAIVPARWLFRNGRNFHAITLLVGTTRIPFCVWLFRLEPFFSSRLRSLKYVLFCGSILSFDLL